MPKFFINAENGPAQFTGLSSGSWNTDIDLDLDASFVGSAPTIPATATGVILRFFQPDSTQNLIGAQAYDSSKDRVAQISALGGSAQVDAYVGIDTAHQIDVYIGHTEVQVYLLGYFTAEANFFSDVDQHTFTPTASGSWETVDLSAYLTAGASFAILEYTTTAGNRYTNFRHPDSTEDHTSGRGNLHSWAVVPVDSSGNIEMKNENTTVTTLHVVGEIISNATARTSGGDVSLTTTGSYQPIDTTSLSPDSGTVLAVMEIRAIGGLSWAIRPFDDGSYTYLYADTYDTNTWIVVPIDAANKFDAEIETTGVDFYIWGWITEDSGESLLPIRLNGVSVININKVNFASFSNINSINGVE